MTQAYIAVGNLKIAYYTKNAGQTNTLFFIHGNQFLFF